MGHLVTPAPSPALAASLAETGRNRRVPLGPCHSNGMPSCRAGGFSFGFTLLERGRLSAPVALLPPQPAPSHVGHSAELLCRRLLLPWFSATGGFHSRCRIWCLSAPLQQYPRLHLPYQLCLEASALFKTFWLDGMNKEIYLCVAAALSSSCVDAPGEARVVLPHPLLLHAGNTPAFLSCSSKRLRIPATSSSPYSHQLYHGPQKLEQVLQGHLGQLSPECQQEKRGCHLCVAAGRCGALQGG